MKLRHVMVRNSIPGTSMFSLFASTGLAEFGGRGWRSGGQFISAGLRGDATLAALECRCSSVGFEATDGPDRLCRDVDEGAAASGLTASKRLTRIRRRIRVVAPDHLIRSFFREFGRADRRSQVDWETGSARLVSRRQVFHARLAVSRMRLLVQFT
jgi:hypothetical protein